MRRPVSILALVVVLLAGLASCSSSGSGGTSACQPVQREALDPNERHVLPGAPEPTYRTDPPTSGPHEPGAPLAGVLTTPVSRPRQVGALEGGGVLVQYRDITPDQQHELEALASDRVAVAPNPSLPNRVVATAWLYKQICSTVDTSALRTFVDQHVGGGPGTDLGS